MSPSVETNATLNDDVVREILLWLPSTSVLRCRAVCKAWHNTSTDPLFLAAHARRRPLELLVRAQPDGTVLHTVPLSLHLQVDETREGRRLQLPEHCRANDMIGSCNGLLLFADFLLIFPSFFVYNPVTRQGARLDLWPPSFSFIMVPCGFYLHLSSGEHRILVIANERETGTAAHYVFTAGGAVGPRRLGPVAPDLVLEFYTQYPVHYVHHRGKLHWTSHPEAKRADSILAFDTVSEAFRLIPRPPPRSHDCGEDLCLLEMHGKLAMADILDDSMDLWVLEDYNSDGSWSRRARVDLPPLFHVRWAMGTGVPDVVLVGSYMCGFVGLYHLIEKRIIKQMQLTNGDMGTQAPFLFNDSLVPTAFFS